MQFAVIVVTENGQSLDTLVRSIVESIQPNRRSPTLVITPSATFQKGPKPHTWRDMPHYQGVITILFGLTNRTWASLLVEEIRRALQEEGKNCQVLLKRLDQPRHRRR